MQNLNINWRTAMFAAIAAVAFLFAAQANAMTYTVTNTNPSGAGSLRQAVLDANGTPAADTIVFNIPTTDAGCVAATGGCTIVLTATAGNDEIVISSAGGALTINGTGANRLTISGGTGADRIFSSTNAIFTLRGVTLTGGGGTGSGISGFGGAIQISGGSTLLESIYVTGNSSGSSGGGIAIFGGGTHTIRSSAFSSNTTGSSGAGGGLEIEDSSTQVTITNTIFSGNSANQGGAVRVYSSNVTFRNVTVSGNNALAGSFPTRGGGIDVFAAPFSFVNSIIAGNTSAAAQPEMYISGIGAAVTSSGYNLIGDSAGDSADTGVAITYQTTDIRDTPPLLDALANYGGTVPMMRLQATSPAIDKGSAITGVTMDGRSVIRPFDNPLITNAISGNGADIGAFELETSIVRAWGYGSSGQLGTGSANNRSTPQIVTGGGGITQFGGGDEHSVALLSNGTVVTSGDDFYEQQGDGTPGSTDRSNYGAVVNLTNITQVSGGADHSLALRSDGTVWAWGRNNNGQLGNGTTGTNAATPVQVGASVSGFNGRVVQVSATNHNLALTDDGKVWAWGNNFSGQLGNGTMTNSNVPIPVRVSAGGAQLFGIVSISAGDGHSAALKSDGTVVVWGYNGEGQVGNNTTAASVPYPTQTTNSLMGTVVQISAGVDHNVAVNTAGDVYAWGNGGNAEIGDNNTADALVPRKVSTVSNIVRIEAHHSFHALARRRDGTMFVWGRNNLGQIGNGTTTNQLSPLDISAPAGTGGNLGTNIAVFGAGVSNSHASTLPDISTPAGASVLRGDNFSIAFPASTQTGQTQVRVFDPTATGLSVPSGYGIVANSTGYDITSSAQFPGTATICLKVPNVINQTDFNKLYILHDDDGDGTLDAVNGARDYQRRDICRATASFSPFVVALGPTPPATAASVSISGRVITPQEFGLTNAFVTLTDLDGEARTVRTGKFGSFRFMDVAAGGTYILSVQSKHYTYAPQMITVTEDMTDLSFAPQ